MQTDVKNAPHIRKPGVKSRNLHSELEPEVVLAAILAKKPKIGGFLSPVLPLPLAMQGRYWGPSLVFGPLDVTCCGKTVRCHVVQRDSATSHCADGPRDATVCGKTARCHTVQKDRATLWRAEKLCYATWCRGTALCHVVLRDRATSGRAEGPRNAIWC